MAKILHFNPQLFSKNCFETLNYIVQRLREKDKLQKVIEREHEKEENYNVCVCAKLTPRRTKMN